MSISVWDTYQRLKSGVGSSQDKRPTQDEVLLLIAIIRTTDDPELESFCRDLLMLRYVRLVTNCVKRYVNKGLGMTDLISYGMIGLSRAIDKYDPSKGYQFTTYVQPWILKPVRTALLEVSFIGLPLYRHEQLFRIRREMGRSDLLHLDPDALVAHLALALLLPTVVIVELLSIAAYDVTGLDDALHIPEPEDVQSPLLELSGDSYRVLDLVYGLETYPGKPKSIQKVSLELDLPVSMVETIHQDTVYLLKHLLESPEG